MTKSLRLYALAMIMIVLSQSIANARLIKHWSHQELYDKSDMVIIATATATNETRESTKLPELEAQSVVGVETKFSISAILKGDKKTTELILHHYREDGMSIPNGPSLVSFDPVKKRTYLLFLVREADGRYAPTVGQVDPAWCGINVLGGFEE